MDKSELLRTLWQRRVVALIVAVLVVGGSLLFLRSQRPVYEAKATVALLPNASRPETLGAYDSLVARLLPLYASLVRSRTFLDQVAARMPDQPDGEELRGRVFARPGSGAAVIDVVARSPDPQFAIQAAAAATAEFRDQVGGNAAVTVRVIDEVHQPEAVAPRPKLVLTASLLLAVALGVAVALAWERLFGRIRDLSQLPGPPRQRVLGEFPRDRALQRSSEPLFLGNPTMRSIEDSLRAIRTVMVGPGRAVPTFRRMAVTSLNRGDGKSTLTANLAVVIAEVGSQVLVVDGDVQRPRQHEIFQLSNDRGLSSPVLGDGDVASAIQPTLYPKVSVLPAGPPLTRRSEIAELYVQVIPKLDEFADFVLIDCPALAVDADVELLAAMTDGVIVLVRSGTTSTEQLNAVMEHLRASGVPIQGLILTMGPNPRSRRGIS